MEDKKGEWRLRQQRALTLLLKSYKIPPHRIRCQQGETEILSEVRKSCSTVKFWSKEVLRNTDDRPKHNVQRALAQNAQTVHHKMDAWGYFWSCTAYTKLRLINDWKCWTQAPRQLGNWHKWLHCPKEKGLYGSRGASWRNKARKHFTKSVGSCNARQDSSRYRAYGKLLWKRTKMLLKGHLIVKCHSQNIKVYTPTLQTPSEQCNSELLGATGNAWCVTWRLSLS